MEYIILVCERDHLFIVARRSSNMKKNYIYKTVAECPDMESAMICLNAFNQNYAKQEWQKTL